MYRILTASPRHQVFVLLGLALLFQLFYLLLPPPLRTSPLLAWLPLIFGAVSLVSWALARKLVGPLSYSVVYLSALGQVLLLGSLHAWW